MRLPDVDSPCCTRGDNDKQVIQSNGVSMLAHGHKDVKVVNSTMSVSQWFQTAGPPKMDEMKQISNMEFKVFIEDRGFKGRKT